MPGSRRAGKDEKKVPRSRAAKTAAPRPKPAKPAARLLTGIAGRAGAIAKILIRHYPDARCMLDHADPFQLLVATILAAQCTDDRVNKVTPALFARFPAPAAMAAADIGELETLIRSTGFFHNKARSIKGAAEALAQRFPDGFPNRMESLLTLPGVGRKTANVIMGTCFGAPAIIVDTHVRRVVQRLGIVTADNPDRIEEELAVIIPQQSWTAFSHAVTFHGRRCCAARKPDHDACPVRALCDSRDI
jgi:endonuclease III